MSKREGVKERNKEKRKGKERRGKRLKDECREINREQRTDIARNRERERRGSKVQGYDWLLGTGQK